MLLRILHLIRSADPASGGPIEGVRQFGTALVSAGHSVEVASLDPPGAPFLQQTQLPVYPLGPSHFKYGFTPRFVPWLRANKGRYDVVIVNGIWQFHSLGAWSVLRNSSVPYFVFTHGMLDPWFKKEYPLKHLKKWTYWPWAEYRVLRDAQAVLFTCEQERVLARSSFWLYRCNEVVLSYGTGQPKGNPELELREFFGQYPELRGKRLALFMGRIHPKKGCDLLIKAFSVVLGQDSDWHLVIAGPDQVGLRKELTYQAAELGLASRITWTGMISGTTKWGALRAAEIFVLPSHQENFGIVVAEALAVGVPTLISNKVNIWREVASDGAGLVCADSFQGTCELLRSYVAMPEEKIAAMRQAAVDCFEQRFEIKKAAGNLHAVLSRVTGNN